MTESTFLVLFFEKSHQWLFWSLIFCQWIFWDEMKTSVTKGEINPKRLLTYVLCYSRKVIIITAPRIGGHRGHSSISSSGLYLSLGCKPRINVRMRPIGLSFTSNCNHVLASLTASPPILWLRPVKYWPRYTSHYPVRLFLCEASVII